MDNFFFNCFGAAPGTLSWGNEHPLNFCVAKFPSQKGPPDLGFLCVSTAQGRPARLGEAQGHLLGWLLHGAVGIEGLELVLDSAQGVGQLPVIEGHDGLLDPLEQLGGQGFILLHQALCLHGVV